MFVVVECGIIITFISRFNSVHNTSSVSFGNSHTLSVTFYLVRNGLIKHITILDENEACAYKNGIHALDVWIRRSKSKKIKIRKTGIERMC